MAGAIETEAECVARGGTVLRHPVTGKMIACYPPRRSDLPFADDVRRAIEKFKKRQRDEAILVIGGIVLVYLAYRDRR